MIINKIGEFENEHGELFEVLREFELKGRNFIGKRFLITGDEFDWIPQYVCDLDKWIYFPELKMTTVCESGFWMTQDEVKKLKNIIESQ